MDKEEILINSQVALFFDQPLKKPEDFWQPLNEIMDEIFDQTPMILPVPNEPSLNEVPIVQMRSGSGIYSCNISRGRADFFHNGSQEQDKFSDIEELFINNEAQNFFAFFNDRQIKIKRIGFITRFFIEEEKQDEVIAKLLNNNFKRLHDGATYETYIRYVSRDVFDELKINNYTSIERSNAKIKTKGNNIKGILITRDFNTIPEEDFSKNTTIGIDQFIEKGRDKFNLKAIKEELWSEQEQEL